MSSTTLTIPTTSSTSSSLPASRQPASRGLKTPSPSTWSKPRSVIGGHREKVNGVDWSLDGKKIASCSQGDKGIRVWDVLGTGSTLDPRQSQLLGSPHTRDSVILDVKFDPSHLSELVSMGGKGSDSRVCWWDLRTPLKPVTNLNVPYQPFRVTHHPSDRVVAVSDIKEVITFYDQRMLPLSSSSASTSLAADSMDGVEEQKEMTMGWAKSEEYWFPDTQAFSRKGEKVVVYDISFSATGADLLIALGSGRVACRSFTSLSKGHADKPDPGLYEFAAHQGTINALSVDRSGRFIATAGVDAIVNLWDADGLIGLKSYGDMAGEIKNLAFSHDGELLAAGAADEKAIYIFSTVTESLVYKVPTPGPSLSLSWSPKSDVLVYACQESSSSGCFNILSAF
ncbi:WD40-repeat-containing domain protein [Mrakia frigida]|uniref:WD40 repeat domain-containing protein n=1 Tax=Mrakia frigida TaxID=29902 RepID=UPI003FCC1D9A